MRPDEVPTNIDREFIYERSETFVKRLEEMAAAYRESLNILRSGSTATQLTMFYISTRYTEYLFREAYEAAQDLNFVIFEDVAKTHKIVREAESEPKDERQG